MKPSESRLAIAWIASVLVIGLLLAINIAAENNTTHTDVGYSETPVNTPRVVESHYTAETQAADPIYIDGDYDLIAQAAIYEWPGLGTEAQPYIIENLNIDVAGADASCIEIRNIISTYFIIRGCTLEGATPDVLSLYNRRAGIYFYNVFGAEVTSNLCIGNLEGINLNRSSYCVVSDNECADSIWDGIAITDLSMQNEIVDNYCYGSLFHGILVWSGCSMNTVSRNLCLFNSYSGIAVHNWMGLHPSPTHNYISENNCTANGLWGIGVSVVSNDNVLENNFCQTNEYGIYVGGSNENVVRNNFCLSNEVGIFVAALNNGADYNQIVNNTCVENIQSGIMLEFSHHNTLIGNDVSNCNEGIFVANSDDNMIFSNTIVNCIRGIYLSASHENIISSNNCTDNAPYGIFLERSSDNEIVGNNCSQNDYDGISIRNGSSSNEIINNICSYNGDGVFIGLGEQGSNENNVSWNVCTFNWYSGIHVGYWRFTQENCVNNYLFENICDENKYGIYVEGYSDHTTVEQNSCNGNVIGIYIRESDANNIIENICTDDTQSGIHLEFSNQITLSGNNVSNCNQGIYLESSSGIQIDGLEGASKITGYNGESTGIFLFDCDYVTVRDYWVMGFDTAIMVQQTRHCSIEANHVRDNNWALFMGSTNHSAVLRNIFTVNINGIGLDASSYSNEIFLNLFIDNDIQVSIEGNPDDNLWYSQELELGNFWSNYWGKDKNGDGVGDRRLPHEGVDWYPLLDPSIPSMYGQLPIGDDWWGGIFPVWRGGLSLVEIQVTDSLGRTLSEHENDFGPNAWFIVHTELNGSQYILVIIITPVHELELQPNYSFEMSALEDTTYSMEWFVSFEGDVLFERSVVDVPLAVGETRSVEVELEQTPEGDIAVEVVAQYDFSGFLRPINPDGTSVFNQGHTVPVKFQLFDENGNPDGTAYATLELAMVIDGVVGDFMPADSTSAADMANVFRYDEDEAHYIFNLSTAELDLGIYILRITFDDGQQFMVQIEFR